MHQKFTTLEKITFAEFDKRINKEAKEKLKRRVANNPDAKLKIKISQRKLFWIHLIKNGNLTCPVTGKNVAYCGYDRADYKKGPSSFHYNFYSEDGDLFTIDHRLPKSQGGANSIDNVQPMIAEENWAKSNNLIFL
ncbi:MAG: HNH endonuclease [Candidatus Pacearchaeota archaeon]|jgi:hypothetical protein|nr:HNH endonuclease [Clostridia bacterium]